MGKGMSGLPALSAPPLPGPLRGRGRVCTETEHMSTKMSSRYRPGKGSRVEGLLDERRSSLR